MAVYMFPGQGSQKQGMGEDLFADFPELVHCADQLLGYSIVDICLKNEHDGLSNTAFTQPALYVVNALSYLKKMHAGAVKPDYFLGHSLGEYNALWAAGVFDFPTGLRLVQERGRLMSQARNGAMAAVIGLSSDDVSSILEEHGLSELSIANYNANLQQVISGPNEAIERAKPFFINAKAKLYVPLPVNGAFHSPLMQQARVQFVAFLKEFKWAAPEVPVIANINAKPYEVDDILSSLAMQIDHPVQWLQSIRYLLSHDQEQFEEIGPGTVLTNMVIKIKAGK